MGAVSTPGLPLAPESFSPSRGRARAIAAWTESASGSFWDSSAGRLAVRRQRFGRSLRHRAESGREVDGHRRRSPRPQPGNLFRARRPWPSARASWPRSSTPSIASRMSRREMNLIFRDHTISDLIGFVYSGMPPQDAAHHLMHNIKQAAQPVLDAGHDAVVPIILDGENAWEYYPQSGREFLRRFYDALQREAGVEATTVSEAIAAAPRCFRRSSRWFRAPGFTPTSMSGSAPRKTTAPGTISTTPAISMPRPRPRPSEAQRQLAFEEILIAEGSDWNWWYGPEHHSANDREFDELYRKHLSNIYQAARRRAARLSGAAHHRRRGAAGGAAADRLHPSPDHGRHGALLRMDGGGRLHRRPPRRRHARQTVSARRRPRGNRRVLHLRTPRLCREQSSGRRISNSWSIWNPGRMKASGHAARCVSTSRVEAGRIRSWKVECSRCRESLASSDRPSDQVTVALFRNFEFKIPAGLVAGHSRDSRTAECERRT